MAAATTAAWPFELPSGARYSPFQWQQLEQTTARVNIRFTKETNAPLEERAPINKQAAILLFERKQQHVTFEKIPAPRRET